MRAPSRKFASLHYLPRQQSDMHNRRWAHVGFSCLCFFPKKVDACSNWATGFNLESPAQKGDCWRNPKGKLLIITWFRMGIRACKDFLMVIHDMRGFLNFYQKWFHSCFCSSPFLQCCEFLIRAAWFWRSWHSSFRATIFLEILLLASGWLWHQNL